MESTAAQPGAAGHGPASEDGAVRFFAETYAAARTGFLAAAQAAGATIESFRHPAAGPSGEILATDLAWLGPRDADRVMVTISATHGVEGHCGSAIQTGALATRLDRALPEGIATLAIHAINPHGFAWGRRINEDNVDLNRNYVDHGLPLPVNDGYAALRDSICPTRWDAATRARCNAAFDAYRERHGALALASALTGGQYNDPTGVYYGGAGPTWSRRTLTEILQRFCGHARHVAVIDLHTGLGPFGYGEVMNDHEPTEPGYARINHWFGGEATTFDTGTSSSPVTSGSTVTGVARALPHAALSEITLEYGTVPLMAMIESVRADNWLRQHGDPDSDQGRAIKAEMRAAFYPDGDDWKRKIWARALDVQRRMAKGLSEA